MWGWIRGWDFVVHEQWLAGRPTASQEIARDPRGDSSWKNKILC